MDLISKLQVISQMQVAKVMRQLLSAVECCHRMDVVHRDIKPDNLLFENPDINSRLKVIDFGRSKLLKPQQKLIEKAGSLYYVAPEIISCMEYNQSCDLWSCGIIMFMMLTGAPPFCSPSKDETIALIKQGKVDYSRI